MNKNGNDKILVTKTKLPELTEYVKHLKGIWNRNIVTNHGPLNNLLENKLKKYLGVKNLSILSNGTVAIEVAINVLGIHGEVITTPFSYVATTTSLLWTNCKPVFADIDHDSLCINPELIEKKITSKTTAILATHVFGNPCEVEKIGKIAKKYNLKVIYDAAHCFGVNYKNKSILNYGDASTISFHATKIFHTIEGGAIITNNRKTSDKVFLYKSFGHIGDNYFTIGINGKNSEFHAAMGLCNLPLVKTIMEKRKKITETYKKYLNDFYIRYPSKNKYATQNFAYFPVIFISRKEMQKAKNELGQNNIFPRRYFYPSLNKLPYIKNIKCPISESISEKILCLPLYDGLKKEDIIRICNLVNQSF